MPSAWRAQLGGHDVHAIEFLEQVAHQGGLAGADAAGDDDEPLSLLQAVAQVGHGPVVPLAVEEELVIRGQLEGLTLEVIEVVVHVLLNLCPLRV